METITILDKQFVPYLSAEEIQEKVAILAKQLLLIQIVMTLKHYQCNLIKRLIFPIINSNNKLIY